METPEPQPFFKRLQAKLAASRFFMFSALLHVVIVIVGGSAVLMKAMDKVEDFEASGGGELVTQEVSATPPPPDTPQVEEVFTPTQPVVETPTLDAIVSTNTSNPTFQMAAATLPSIKAPASDMSKAIASIPKTMGSGAGKGIPGAMGSRMGSTARNTAMMKQGGKEKSEKAVMAGLRWLKANQSADGSWSPDQKSAMTALAILCFLGHGETPESPEFGPTVKKGVDWLIDKGTQFEGRMSLTKDGWGGHSGVYAHGIATYAMGEYYTMTKDERMLEPLKKAVKFIVDGQAPNGGWQYDYDKGPSSDTSVAGWQVQALKAAHLTGLSIEGVDAALDKSMLYFKEAQKEDGSFGYRNNTGGNGYSLSGVGTLCVYFWKGNKDELVRKGIKSILEKSEKDFPVEYKHEKADLYAWYYHTQACLMFGGSAWDKWNRMFQDQIADNQSGDGSWPPIAGKSAGGGMMAQAGGGGPFYRTTLCILMLEVFYRYMPTTKA